MTDSSSTQDLEDVPERKGARLTVRYYLDSGAVIEFEARKIGVTQGSLAGDLRGYSFEDAVGEVPFWVDVTRVIAITRTVEDDTP